MSKTGSSTTELVAETEKSTNRSNTLPQYIAAIAVCTGVLGAGCVTGWTANITEELRNGELNGIQVSDAALGWVGSLTPLGAMVMCFPIGIMCDKLGRKLALLLFTIPFLVGWLLIIFSKSIEMLYAGRFITGLAGGAFCVAAPLYISEIAVKEIRGQLGLFFQLFLGTGNIVTFILGYATSVKINTIIVGVIPLIFALLFAFQPESPVYRMKQNKEAEARAALIRLRGNKYDVDAELKEITLALEEEVTFNITFKDSVKKRSTKKAALVCFSLMFFQQAGGVSGIMYYTSDVFRSAGAGLDEKLSTIIVAALACMTVFFSSRIIDRFGRKILLVLSGVFMAVGVAVLGVFFTLKDRGLATEETLSKISFLPLLALLVYLIAFAIGFGPIPWMMSAELFPQEIKSTATAAVGTFNWFLVFVMTKWFIQLNSSLGADGTFYLFAGMSFLGAVFVFTVVPETKGKTLHQIQMELNGQHYDEGEVKMADNMQNSL